jgi:methionyl-tRNA formyltransferase
MKDKKQIRIAIFTAWGGSFAVPILKKLFNSEYNIIGIYTQGVHWKRLEKYNIDYYSNYQDNIKVMIFNNGFGDKYKKIKSANDSEVISEIQKHDIDYIFTIGYGEILKKGIISSTNKGIVNFHPGILPENQGADPFASVITNRIDYTGITMHFINENIDTGDIILQKELEISSNDDYRLLEIKLGILAANSLKELYEVLIQDKVKTYKQDKSKARYFKKPQMKNGQFNFSMTSREIVSLVNTYIAFPETAFFLLDGNKIYVKKAQVIPNDMTPVLPGEIVDQGLDYVFINTKDYPLLLSDLRVNNLDKNESVKFLNRLYNKYEIIS